jgi:hypothetical protein
MDSRGKRIVRSIGKGLIGIIRFVLYVLLLVLGRVLQPIANLAIGVGLLIFLFCLFVRPDMTLPMWAGAGLAVVATIVSVFYEAALSLVAPADVVIVREV